MKLGESDDLAPVKTVVVLGSSRGDGNTRAVVAGLVRLAGWDVVDLAGFHISHYDYGHTDRNDDFIGIMRTLTEGYDNLIFATPVYWYAMSGVLKVFFDRFTDLLEIEKGTGRKLRGKGMGGVSSSIGDHLGDSFWLPFENTANYLGMRFIGGLHTVVDRVTVGELKDFVEKVDRGL